VCSYLFLFRAGGALGRCRNRGLLWVNVGGVGGLGLVRLGLEWSGWGFYFFFFSFFILFFFLIFFLFFFFFFFFVFIFFLFFFFFLGLHRYLNRSPHTTRCDHPTHHTRENRPSHARKRLQHSPYIQYERETESHHRHKRSSQFSRAPSGEFS